MEVIKNFDFVSVIKEDAAKKKTLTLMAESMQAAQLASEGKIKSRSAKAFLDEL